MQTTFWSRRSFVSALTAVMAAATSPIALAPLARAATTGGETVDPLALPDTDRLKDGFKPAIVEDLQVVTATVSSTGGKAVKRDASAALSTGTQAALEDFLLEGQYTAREEDMRVEISTVMFTAGPEVQKYADRALSGTAADVQWFLDTGQHIARARDQESATIEELVAVVEREGKRAQAETDEAAEASERAKTAAEKAKEAAETAAAEAGAAKDDVQKSAAAAGQAIDYANKSIVHAAAAVDAANTATKAVEQAAREAELARLDECKQQGLDEAAELAQIEADERADYENKRAQAEQTGQAIKGLISQAEQALAGNDLALAATLGRKASIGLLDANGAWTREAAQFALSGTDADVHAWIDTDRAIAQGQDDRETAVYYAQVSAPGIAVAAQTALESDADDAARTFLTTGAIEAAADDYRVQVLRILNSNPGSAVKAAAQAALDANTPKALQDFFDTAYRDAIREDDAVATASLINNGGAYTKAHAEVALEGPTWMRRNFIDVVQHKTAQLDYDSATHIAAIRGAIAAAAKIAYKAQEDAALASKAAAEARKAADEAAEWADKAEALADKAAGYADEARKNAHDADKSAASAQASADKAKTAAEAARGAARSANYSRTRRSTPPAAP
ncbi:hypothetical protein ACFXOS_25470 [Streptomyces sp. NPDC059175]|uniref:hypothetical protein n=1 Tax=Streptomyces sp. NPDC059175 TaxID=3346757 RepID=UPI0036C4F0C7